MRETLRIFAVLLAFALGVSGTAYAGDEAGEESGSPPVDSAPPSDDADADDATQEGDGEAEGQDE